MISADTEYNNISQETNIMLEETVNIDQELPIQEEEIIEEDKPFQHEDEETYLLRITYEQALRETGIELDDDAIVVIASMVVKKAKYGVVYEKEIEDVITDLNTAIRDFYTSEE